MAFPTTLTGATDNVTEIIAAHLNQVEAKIGVDGSAVTSSLDYLIKSTSSIDPGHKHSELWASDGSPQAIDVDASGNVGIGTSTFGTNSAGVFGLFNGTAPSTSPADMVQLWSADRGSVAGKAGLHIRTEDGTSHVIGDMIGFGTIAPDYTLHHKGAGAKTIAVESTDDISGVLTKSGSEYWSLYITTSGHLNITNASYALTYTKGGNFGIGTGTTFGTSAAHVFGIYSGTAPASSPADMVQLWCADLNGTAGDAALHLRTESGVIYHFGSKFGINTSAPDGLLDVLSTDKFNVYIPAAAFGSSGTYGIVIDKLSTVDPAGASGLIFAENGTAIWALGLDSGGDDFVLAYEVGVGDQLRVASNGKFVMGYSVGVPNQNNRFEINSDDSEVSSKAFQNLLLLTKSTSASITNFMACYNTATTSYPFVVDISGNLTCATCWTQGPTLRIATPYTITNATDSGTIGMIVWDTGYIYVCTATDTWKRAQLSSW